MRAIARTLVSLSSLLTASPPALGGDYTGKKSMYVNSYHLGPRGSDPITGGICGVLDPPGLAWRIEEKEIAIPPEGWQRLGPLSRLRKREVTWIWAVGCGRTA